MLIEHLCIFVSPAPGANIAIGKQRTSSRLECPFITRVGGGAADIVWQTGTRLRVRMRLQVEGREVGGGEGAYSPEERFAFFLSLGITWVPNLRDQIGVQMHAFKDSKNHPQYLFGQTLKVTYWSPLVLLSPHGVLK